jgi:hypothetical protein
MSEEKRQGLSTQSSVPFETERDAESTEETAALLLN